MVDRRQPARLIDTPSPCFIRLRTVSKGPWYAARIYRCLGLLCGEINGSSADPMQIWHGGDQISEAEYHALLLAANTPKPF